MLRDAVRAVLIGLVVLGVSLVGTVVPASAAPVLEDPPVAPTVVSTAVTLTAPPSVLDEALAVVSVQVTFAMSDGTSAPGAGVSVLLSASEPGVGWHRIAELVTDASGFSSVQLQPRADTSYSASVVGGATYPPADSAVVTVRNLPPYAPADLPLASPRPSISLPAQPRAEGAGANPIVTGIPNQVRRNMVGRSWHRGCPVGRKRLRLVTTNYVGYDGYRHRGELVVHAAIAAKTAQTFTALHDAGFPIRAMYRPDIFGWSRKLKGADDYKSMRSGNTYVFNCRWVVGRPGVRSPHSWGRSLDLNAWENPFYSRRDGWVPNTWWPTQNIGWLTPRSASDRLVTLMRGLGWRWTYGTADSQHFDG